MIRNLPQRLGGLGLPRHFGPQSEKACLASRALTLAYITEHRQDLQSGTEKWPEIEVGDSDGSRFRAEIVIENEEIEDLDHTLPDDVQTVIAEHKYNWMSVYKHLPAAVGQETPCGMVSQWHQQRHGQVARLAWRRGRPLQVSSG